MYGWLNGAAFGPPGLHLCDKQYTLSLRQVLNGVANVDEVPQYELTSLIADMSHKQISLERRQDSYGGISSPGLTYLERLY